MLFRSRNTVGGGQCRTKFRQTVINARNIFRINPRQEILLVAAHHQHDDCQLVGLVLVQRFLDIVNRCAQTAKQATFFIQADFLLQISDDFELRRIIVKGRRNGRNLTIKRIKGRII